MSGTDAIVEFLLREIQAMEDLAVESMQEAGGYRSVALLAVAQVQAQRAELTRLRRRLREFAMSDLDRLEADETQRVLQGE